MAFSEAYPFHVKDYFFDLLTVSKYGEHTIPDYQSKPRDQLIPHLYAVAEDAFKSLRLGQSQACVISGESGAGKTEGIPLNTILSDNE